MQWIETTLRKGTKTPKVCRDMFVSDSRGEFELVTVKNGRISNRGVIDNIESAKIIKDNELIGVGSSIFNGCWAYRTKASNDLIAKIINS